MVANARRILDEARETLRRTARADTYLPPVDDALDRWRALQPKPEPAPRQRKLDTQPPPAFTLDDVDARIAAAVEQTRAFNRDVLIGIVAELTAKFEKEVKRLNAEITSLRTARQPMPPPQKDLKVVNGHA